MILLGLVFQGCATGDKSSQEVRVGEEIHAAILQSFYPYTDPQVVSYVNEVGESLAAHTERRELPYRFTVLYSDKIYATSAPGGYVYLTTGMLFFLENEAQLAGVLAHEIGELQFRSPKIVTKNQKVLETAAKGTMIASSFLGPISALAAMGLAAASQINMPPAVVPEEQLILSDEKALYYMMKAGQDPQGLIDVLYKLLRSENEVIPYFADYHHSRPLTYERITTLEKNFSELPLQNRTFDTRRDLYQEVTKGIREMYR